MNQNYDMRWLFALIFVVCVTLSGWLGYLIGAGQIPLFAAKKKVATTTPAASPKISPTPSEILTEDTLNLTVDNSASTPATPSSSPISTSTNSKTFKSSTGHYSFTYPSSWIISSESTKPGGDENPFRLSYIALTNPKLSKDNKIEVEMSKNLGGSSQNDAENWQPSNSHEHATLTSKNGLAIFELVLSDYGRAAFATTHYSFDVNVTIDSQPSNPTLSKTAFDQIVSSLSSSVKPTD